MFEAEAATIEADVARAAEAVRTDFQIPADPEAGWATRNPDRAMLFLFVSPRDCAAVDELMAL